ncbi:Ion transport, K+ channel [Candidatus Koribacter versatilis Ellin345]|uniref:Ion transport, K+ channel n=1 Tax=Koribacter versatilis (strain Ellin345) TaxID=204669 RepID=Q1IUP3_KORVE|nr:potassium channel family protein [Candidatus Koribacter versatilis]ABF39407.1 Ion transport, K+ channel [Candidatus Koribacter versatilis Ellin345]
MFLSGITLTFFKQFGLGIWLTLPVLIAFGLVIALCGQVVGRREGWSRFDSFYWSFVTATTVGYGDLHPSKRGTKMLALFIALLGMSCTGILIAVGVHAITLALAAHDAAGKLH